MSLLKTWVEGYYAGEGASRKKGEDLSPDHVSLDNGLASDPNLRLTCPTCQPCSSASVRPHLFLAATH